MLFMVFLFVSHVNAAIMVRVTFGRLILYAVSKRAVYYEPYF